MTCLLSLFSILQKDGVCHKHVVFDDNVQSDLHPTSMTKSKILLSKHHSTGGGCLSKQIALHNALHNRNVCVFVTCLVDIYF